jgi:hypothetical protein
VASNTTFSKFKRFNITFKQHSFKRQIRDELLNKDIPPGKWWRIAKSISNFTKARDPPPFERDMLKKFVSGLEIE